MSRPRPPTGSLHSTTAATSKYRHQRDVQRPPSPSTRGSGNSRCLPRSALQWAGHLQAPDGESLGWCVVQEGKSFFSLVATSFTPYLKANRFIDIYMQKTGIPGFSGGQEARTEGRDIHVVFCCLGSIVGQLLYWLG